MKEGVKKSISLILVLTLLVQLLPVVAFGVGDETNDLDISTDSETVSMKDDDAEIVGEEDALREESVKHFRLRDGGYMLVEYETAVHYQTADGSWEEIDNTLQKTGQQYVAQAGDMTRKFAASLDSGFLFETAYQGQSVSMSLARRSSRDVVAVAPDVPAAEETAAPEETAASETADQLQEAEQTEADQTQEPAEAAAETDAPQQETAEELPLLDDAAYTLVTSTAAARMENPGAKMRTFSKLAEKDKIQPQKIRSSVAFDNVMDGVSLLYQNYGYNVKESIIIDKQQEQYAYSFVLNMQGLTPTLEADGSVLLRSAGGEVIYEIPAPSLADANNVTSVEDAAYRLERIQGGYLLTVTENGQGRRTPLEEYRTQNRGGRGVRNYDCVGKETPVAGVRVVGEEDDVILIADDGIIIRIPCEQIAVQSRYGGGVHAMRLEEGSRVVALARAPREEDTEEAEPAEGEEITEPAEPMAEEPTPEE